MKHIKYLKYIIIHKAHVALECFKLGLYYQGLTHDLSKLLPIEWFPYVNYFYGDYGIQNKCPAKWAHPGDIVHQTKWNFDSAWLKHIHRNKHHWQYWILREGSGEIIALRMPDKYAKEMVCDWIGASIAITGKNDVKAWYKKNKKNIMLHPKTSSLVESLLLKEDITI